MQLNLLAQVLAALLLAASILVESQSSSCNLNDAELVRQRRLRNLKANILAQLGVDISEGINNTIPISTASGSPVSEESVRETFEALRSASASLERERERKCRSDDFFAKPVTSFVGVMAPEGKGMDLHRQ